MEFGPMRSKFVYALEATESTDTVLAQYENDRLSVLLPAERARHWARSEEVGIEADLAGLRVLVEKDFACLKPRSGENESDMFPNPGSTTC